MVELLLQHCSKSENRESILKDGLLPRQPSVDGNYIGCTHLLTQPRGVYAALANEAYGWQDNIYEDEDIYEFTWVGCIKPDPYFFEDSVNTPNVVIDGKITADKLTLVKR